MCKNLFILRLQMYNKKKHLFYLHCTRPSNCKIKGRNSINDYTFYLDVKLNVIENYKFQWIATIVKSYMFVRF